MNLRSLHSQGPPRPGKVKGSPCSLHFAGRVTEGKGPGSYIIWWNMGSHCKKGTHNGAWRLKVTPAPMATGHSQVLGSTYRDFRFRSPGPGNP